MFNFPPAANQLFKASLAHGFMDTSLATGSYNSPSVITIPNSFLEAISLKALSIGAPLFKLPSTL